MDNKEAIIKELNMINNNLSKLNDSLDLLNVIKLKNLYQHNDAKALIVQMKELKEEIKAIKTNNKITNTKDIMESTSSKIANDLKGFR